VMVWALTHGQPELASAAQTLTTRLVAEADSMMKYATVGEIVAALNDDQELPFSDYRRASGINARGLSTRLRPYRVGPCLHRLGGDRKRGYRRNQFERAWERYLESSASTAGSLSVPSVPSATNGAVEPKTAARIGPGGTDVSVPPPESVPPSNGVAEPNGTGGTDGTDKYTTVSDEVSDDAWPDLPVELEPPPPCSDPSACEYRDRHPNGPWTCEHNHPRGAA